jgi:hypothetical protein
MTRDFGNTYGSGSSPKNLGALNVCAQTYTHQPLMWIMSILTAVIQSYSSKVLSSLFVNPAILEKQCKRLGGGVAKMFESGRQQARWVNNTKKIPNVKNRAIEHGRRYSNAGA